jgi:anti-sigma-K factor RskA
MSPDETTPEMLENVGAWVLGALDESEVRAFRAELVRSDALQDEVDRLQPAADALLIGVEQHAAPPELGARLMATVRSEAQLRQAADGERAPEPAAAPARRERRGWLGLRPGFAAALAAVLIAVLVGGGILVTSGGDGGGPATTVQAKVSKPGGTGVVVIRKDGAELAISGVRDPGAGRTYEVWLMPKGSKVPERSVLFRTGDDGSASVHIPADLTKYDAVLVSEEPAGGSDAPTTQPFVSATV